jgi:hypothetical protein
VIAFVSPNGIDGLGIDGDMGVRILLAKMIGDDGLAVTYHVEAASGDARLPCFGAMELAEIAQRRLEGALIGNGRAGDLRSGKRDRGGEPTRHGDLPLLSPSDGPVLRKARRRSNRKSRPHPGQTYPHDPTYPQADSVCATRGEVTPSARGQERPRRKRTECSGTSPKRMLRRLERAETADAAAGRSEEEA